MTPAAPDKDAPEPRWPAVLALLAISGLYWGLPEHLTAGPSWLLLAVVAILLVPTIHTHRRGLHDINQALGYVVLGAVTAAMIASLALLIAALPAHTESPRVLLRSAAALWVSNILVFASWYWRLDAGGPHKRDARSHHAEGAFLFPQMTLGKHKGWTPGFVDYLFLAFNTSTAFSPTDVPVLSRWAKLLMMLQAAISFGTVALIAARAVNVL